MPGQKKDQQPPICSTASRRFLKNVSIKDLAQIFYTQTDPQAQDPTNSGECECDLDNCGPGVCCNLHYNCEENQSKEEPTPQQANCSPHCLGKKAAALANENPCCKEMLANVAQETLDMLDTDFEDNVNEQGCYVSNNGIYADNNKPTNQTNKATQNGHHPDSTKRRDDRVKRVSLSSDSIPAIDKSATHRGLPPDFKRRVRNKQHSQDFNNISPHASKYVTHKGAHPESTKVYDNVKQYPLTNDTVIPKSSKPDIPVVHHQGPKKYYIENPNSITPHSPKPEVEDKLQSGNIKQNDHLGDLDIQTQNDGIESRNGRLLKPNSKHSTIKRASVSDTEPAGIKPDCECSKDSILSDETSCSTPESQPLTYHTKETGNSKPLDDIPRSVSYKSLSSSKDSSQDPPKQISEDKGTQFGSNSSPVLNKPVSIASNFCMKKFCKLSRKCPHDIPVDGNAESAFDSTKDKPSTKVEKGKKTASSTGLKEKPETASCSCCFPPAYRQFIQCSGRISGNCNCDKIAK